MEQEKTSFGLAFIQFWRNFFNFTGKTSRITYLYTLIWWVILQVILAIISLLMVIGVAVILSDASLSVEDVKNIMYLLIGILVIIYKMIFIIPMSAVQVRRLNDSGFPVWLSLLLVIGIQVMEFLIIFVFDNAPDIFYELPTAFFILIVLLPTNFMKVKKN